MKIDLYAISNNRVNRLFHRLDFNLNKKEQKATMRVIRREISFLEYLENKREENKNE